MIPTSNSTSQFLSQHPSQESLDAVLNKARTAATRLETFLHRKNSGDSTTPEDDDYRSITSELMNLREHEEALRRELEGVARDCAAASVCASEVLLCSGSFDEDDNGVVECGGPSGYHDAFDMVRSIALREDLDSDDELSRLDIPLPSPRSMLDRLPSMLPLSPWSSFRSDRSSDKSSNRSLYFDDDDDSSRDESIPAMITFDNEKQPTTSNKRTKRARSHSFGLSRQLSQGDFDQLQEDLEAALDDFHTLDKVQEPEQKVSILWTFIVRLAELLYGEAEAADAAAAEKHLGLSKTVEL
uniref:Uncharacterized protein n=1 Tax=Grammatophora oceanica TaxID=210454 RepID=A0A7S1VS27_9STRA|mmetsp:Transcript_580/g.785  ORF Transcript_580/g.785 Transcript_580/m.785 type:complete len:299 (+) Transcript_580:228-1124(+)|eukprot:CAMPEP_0194036102 /NCGR_PEP_ID=MMETSP0009_2-20130614/8487_1 /TAXON_ID=210454 /ORGANISM="Grammatophora oceanica, Strain CCMP 410" /LENGTH=298 /DNA_ID=CAMNT_0038677715 /DNA_START=127 /DNA_END=1023 /DNA_ORIENTATION=+